MRRNGISLGLLLGVFLNAAAAMAQQWTPSNEIESVLGRPKTAPVIPAELRSMVRESHRDRIVVRSLAGRDIVVDISQREPEAFHQFAGGRFLGFSYIGYEHYGYVLIDRAATGEAQQVETGATPAFSADGLHFVAAQLSGAAFGGLEGVGLWAVREGATAPLFFTDVLPDADHWRTDGWAREDCARLSAVAASAQPPAGQDAAAAPRIHFAIEVGERIAFTGSGDQPGCGGAVVRNDDE